MTAKGLQAFHVKSVWPLVLVLDCEVHLQFLSTKKMGTSVVGEFQPWVCEHRRGLNKGDFFGQSSALACVHAFDIDVLHDSTEKKGNAECSRTTCKLCQHVWHQATVASCCGRVLGLSLLGRQIAGSPPA